MNTKGYFQSISNAMKSEELRVAAVVRDVSDTIARWEEFRPHYSEHWQQRGDPIAANLRGTVKCLPDSILCASLLSDLKWVMHKATICRLEKARLRHD